MASNKAKEIEAAGGNIDQIRDILFGKTQKEFERRFNRLEDSVNSEIENLRQESKKMFTTLEGYIRDEIRSLGDQLKIEEKERQNSDKKNFNEIQDLISKLNDFEKESIKTHSEIRQQILDQQKKLSDEMVAQRSEILNKLKNAADELTFAKADRQVLASLFTEIAVRLSDNGETNEPEE